MEDAKKIHFAQKYFFYKWIPGFIGKIWFFSEFSAMKNRVFEKIQSFNRVTANSITWQILKSDMKSCYKNDSKIRKVSLFKKKKIFHKRKK